MYYEHGSLRALAEHLSVSKATLQKYLRNIPKSRPWDGIKQGSKSHATDYLRSLYRKQAMESLERALLQKKTWLDINGNQIPVQAIAKLYAEPPNKISPIMPIYASLKDGRKTIFVFSPKVVCLETEAPQASSGNPRNTSPL